MSNNDILRAVRYMLDLSDARLAQIIALTDPALVSGREEAQALLKKDDEPGATACTDRVLAAFLDGLVTSLRGHDPGRPPRPPERRIDNNMVLKKLRVAFKLQDADMHEILAAAGMPVSKPEMSALFRQPGHKNFRPCGDQLLRHFLRGLTLRVRGTD
ncbi:MAG: DUF1456 family protein [Xanthomonadales bacterium]|nr:DUF1456 family protein [Xanthomonadales bacterium]